MLSIVLHLFLLHPVFNYIKYLNNEPNQKRMTYALLLLSLVSILELGNHMTADHKPNFYEKLGVNPRGVT
jgi:hypothetical protein